MKEKRRDNKGRILHLSLIHILSDMGIHHISRILPLPEMSYTSV